MPPRKLQIPKVLGFSQPGNVPVFADTGGTLLRDSGKNAETLEKKAEWGNVSGVIETQSDLVDYVASHGGGGGGGGDIDGGAASAIYTTEQIIDGGGA